VLLYIDVRSKMDISERSLGSWDRSMERLNEIKHEMTKVRNLA